MLFLLSLLLALCVSLTHAATFRIEHRISTPDQDGDWSLRSYEDPLTAQKTSSTVIDKKLLPTSTPTVDTSTWYYTIKISTDAPDSAFTITSIPFCNLLLPGSSVSRMVKESIVVTPNLIGEPLSATYRITNKKTSSKTSSLCGEVDSEKLKERFVSSVQTSFDIDLGDKADSIPLKVQNGPPPGLQLMPRPKGDTTFKSMGTDPTKDKKAQQQSQSFLGKYWWIILPIAVMTLTAPAEEAPKGK
ncbi:hypothetical protein TrRE_jg12367 [Triparma retinervis]|uniref:ER membrane protein complex subunit 10 n=1 Tax=Triparma retinervis TaxID=2557542 RepID=A0A9W6ZLH5_9STRA|nr:hypothetical protein TrRE_jg12367 [Triparma retinervis]